MRRGLKIAGVVVAAVTVAAAGFSAPGSKRTYDGPQAAALYTRSMLSVLEADFARIPTLIGRAPEPPAPPPPLAARAHAPVEPLQLGLF